ncbi:hypothetical protein TNCV_4761801 [Trichonephila clavipes]|nr:hypothetical protein TNCV_4761801 [Trichonephila clavipes]
MPPDQRCEIHAHESHCDKGLVLPLSLATASNTMKVTASRDQTLFYLEELCYSGLKTVSVTCARYVDKLQNYIIPSLADKHIPEDTTFIHDGPPFHIATRVKDLLRTLFGKDPVLKRLFHHVSPPMSPDLNPNDYCL